MGNKKCANINEYPLKPGSVLLFGYANFYWSILDVDLDNNCMLVMADRIADYRRFNSTDDTDWYSSDLHKWLNGEFLDKAFTPEDRASIIDVNILSFSEQEKYSKYFPNKYYKWICWLRTESTKDEGCIQRIDVGYSVDEYGAEPQGSAGVLPTLLLDLTTPAMRSIIHTHSDGSRYIKVPEYVTNNGKLVNYDYKLTEFEFGDDVISIGKAVFERQLNLKNIVLGDNTVRLDRGAFFACYNLEEIIMPEGLADIEAYAFSHCDNIKNVVIPASVKRIGEDTFSWCSNLERVTFLGNATDIGVFSFKNDQPIIINIPKYGDFKLYPQVSSNDELEAAFECELLNCLMKGYEITYEFLTRSKNYINPNFISLAEVGIDDARRYVMTYIMDYCNAYFRKEEYDNIIWLIEKGYVKNSYISKLIIKAISNEKYDLAIEFLELKEKYGSFAIPELEHYFSLNEDDEIKSIDLQSYLLELKARYFTREELDNYENRRLEQEWEFKEKTLSELKKEYGFKITDRGIVINSYKGNQSEVVVPDNFAGIPVVEIGDEAFSIMRLRNIESKTISKFRNIQSIVLPDTIEKIGYRAFSYCNNLSSVSLPENIVDFDNAFDGCGKLYDSNGFIIINNCLCDSVAEGDVIIPDYVTRISVNAFSDITDIKSITIPKSVIWMDEYMFPHEKHVFKRVTFNVFKGSYAEEYCKNIGAKYRIINY